MVSQYKMQQYYPTKKALIKILLIFTVLFSIVYFTYITNRINILGINKVKNILDLKNIFNRNQTNKLTNNTLLHDAYSSDLYDKTQSIHHVILPNARIKSNINKKFYIIIEETIFYGTTRLCHMKLNEKIIERYKDDEVFKMVFPNNDAHVSPQLYDTLSNCPYDNCFFTCKKELYQIADGFLFLAPQLSQDISDNKDKDYSSLLEKRRNDQLLIMWNDEPGFFINSQIDRYKFNWTITYRTNGDAFNCSYGCYVKRTDVNNSKESFIDEMKKDFETRENKSLWFVSNCEPQNRIRIAAKLSGLYPLTISHNCQEFLRKQNPNAKFLSTIYCSRFSNCESDGILKSKFYLAFESQNCTDYITEKFWRSLSFGAIPIVFQPSKESYERVAPKNSYIHFQDFNFDIELLVEYLNKVSNDFDLFFKHVEWKFNYKAIYKDEHTFSFRICQLCAKLNNEQSNMYYSSVSNWYHERCGIKNS